MADISKLKVNNSDYNIKDATARTDLSNKVPKTFTNGTTTTTHDGKNIIITDTSGETTTSIASSGIKVSDSLNTHSIRVVENVVEDAVTPGLLIEMLDSPDVILYATPDTSSEALLTIGGARLTGITNPINNSDAANKAYVDNFTRVYAQSDEPTNPKEGDVWIVTEPLIAYAVYSADDSSLSFYKTADTITEGSSYRGKTATAVFADIENKAFEFNGNPIPYPIWTLYSGQFNLPMNSIIFVDKGISPTSTASWFTNIRNCTNIIGLNKLNTSNVTDMNNMFAGLGITSIDISDWDTSNVTNMSEMFSYCEQLTSIGDISNWDTSNVTDMNNMFSVCGHLTSIGDISDWDTNNVTNMSNMFAGCYNLTADCSKWDVNKVTTYTNFNSGATSVIAPAWNSAT